MKIGSALLTVVTRLSSFRQDVTMISAVGQNESGEKLLEYPKENKINSELVQVLHDYKTAKAKVMLDETSRKNFV